MNSLILSVAFLAFGLHTTAMEDTSVMSVDAVNTPVDANAALDVNVTNTPAREPDSMFVEIRSPISNQLDEQIYTVPDDKRFMIETVSVTATLGSGIKILRVGLIRNAGPARAVWIPMILQGEDDNGKTYWTGTEQIRMDLRPTEGVRFFALVSGVTGYEFLQANVFGYLMPWDSPSLAP